MDLLQPDAVFDELAKNLHREFGVRTWLVLNSLVVAEFGYRKCNGLKQRFGVHLNGVADSLGVCERNTAAAHKGIIVLAFYSLVARRSM